LDGFVADEEVRELQMTPSADAGLTLEGVSYSYRGDSELALRDVSLTVARGEKVALIGPSGCGKTTLLHLAAGLAVPCSGSVSFGGSHVSDLSPEERSRFRRERVGVVFQFGELIAELSLRDNIALAGELGGLARAEALGRADDLLDRVGIAGVAGRKPGSVSGGQAQRCALARAFCHGPALVLADEPTGALDQANARAAMALMTELATERNATLLVVTHDAEVADACTRLVRMIDGTVAV
jgi:putative ABC transport system ATP-binding protein